MEHTGSSPDGSRAPLVLLSSRVATPGTNVMTPAGSPFANTKSGVPSGTSTSTSTVKVCRESLDVISARPTPSSASPSEGGDRLILSRQSAATSCGSASMNRLITATKPKPSAFIGTDPVRSCLDELLRFDRCPVSAQRAFGLCGVRGDRGHVLSQPCKIVKANRLETGQRHIARFLAYPEWTSRRSKRLIFKGVGWTATARRLGGDVFGDYT